jgi:hypothetical protein
LGKSGAFPSSADDGELAMVSRVVGYGCAALCVALLGFAVWVSAKGDMGAGLVALALAFALMLASLAALHVRSRL